MPVLLLCRGEVEAKNKLRHAIEARYGLTPPAMEQVEIGFKGRARAKIGPIQTWVPVEANASFVFPTQLRWQFTLKPMKLPVQSGIETYDGKMYRFQRAIGSSKESIQTDILASARGRLWQIASILLTPLSDHYVEVSSCGDQCLKATHRDLGDEVRIYLRDDYGMDYTMLRCINPDTEREQNLRMQISHDQLPVDGVMLPAQIDAFWDDEPYFELTPTHLNLQPDFPGDHFTLGRETADDSA